MTHVVGPLAHLGDVMAIAVLAGFCGPLVAGGQPSTPRSEQDRNAYHAAMADADQKIAAAEQAHSEVVENEQYLSTYTGQLVVIDDDTKPEDIASHPGKYKGAIVLTEEGQPCSIDLPEHPTNAYDAVVTPEQREILRVLVQGGPAAAAMMQRFMNSGKVAAALATTGAAAVLRNSCMPDAMLHMGGAGGPAPYEPSALPVAYVSYPDYTWLVRLAKAGQGTFRIDLAGKLSEAPVVVANTVAQIRGSERPDEQVIVGGHLDSWDLGEGAVDARNQVARSSAGRSAGGSSQIDSATATRCRSFRAAPVSEH